MAVLPPVAREFQRLLKDESGATFVEYCLFITLVSIGIGFFAPDLGALVGDLLARAAVGIDAVNTDLDFR